MANETSNIDERTLVPTPSFDTNAMLTAKPVVPIPDTGENGARRGRSIATWLIATVVASAVLGGVAGGLALTFYHRRQAANVAPASAENNTTPAGAPSPIVTENNNAPVNSNTPDAQASAVTNENAQREDAPDANNTKTRTATNDNASRESQDRRVAANRSQQSDNRAQANARNANASNNNRATSTRQRRVDNTARDGERDTTQRPRERPGYVDRVRDVLENRNPRERRRRRENRRDNDGIPGDWIP